MITGLGFRFDGDGTGVGTTVGLRRQAQFQHAFAAMYRGLFRIEFDGCARTIITGPFTPLGLAPETFLFPQPLAVDLIFLATARVKLEANIRWTNGNLD